MAEPVSPIIVAGMHRSGTTLLSNILQRSGLFMGNRQDSHGEAFFFLRLNEWILSQTHCSWDNVRQFDAMDNFTRRQLVRVAQRHINGIRRFSFLGPGCFFRYPGLEALDIPWGWKDPRNTITIDIWKQIFPKARIIHVFRHPVDVAQSLRKREERAHRLLFGPQTKLRNTHIFKARLKWKEFFLSPGGWYPYMPATPSLYSRSVSTLDNGFRVWKDYMERGLDLDRRFSGDVLHIRYESFLEQPREGLEQLFEFTGLSATPATIGRILQDLDAGRKFAFLTDPELVGFFQTIQDEPLLQKLHYHTVSS